MVASCSFAVTHCWCIWSGCYC